MTTKKILIADDLASLRLLLETMLKKEGYQVLSASSGEEAMDLFRRHCNEIGLLIFDVEMDRMSGPETFKQISINRNLPVIFLSGEIRKIEFDNNGVVVLMRKPYVMQTLIRLVRALLPS